MNACTRWLAGLTLALGSLARAAAIFLDNLGRWLRGDPLRNRA